MSKSPRTWFLYAFAMLLVAAATSTASAQSAATERNSKTSVEVRQPTPAELKALSEQMAAMTSEEDSDLVVVTHKNGMKSVDLKGRFQSVAVAKRNSDGTVSMSCVDSAEEGTKFLTSKNKKSAARQQAARAEKE